MSEIKKEEVKSAIITVTYETTRGRGASDFTTLQNLKIWLDKNPLIAEKLGYTKNK